MKIYAVFGEDGSSRGFYPDFAFPDALDEDGNFLARSPGVPDEAVEITEDQWKLFAGNPAGWRWVDGEATPYVPPPFVPAQVSRAQGKIQLRRAGLWPSVLALVPKDETGELEFWLNDATYWSRTSPYVSTMAATLNLTEDQVDQLFIEAAKINAE